MWQKNFKKDFAHFCFFNAILTFFFLGGASFASFWNSQIWKKIYGCDARNKVQSVAQHEIPKNDETLPKYLSKEQTPIQKGNKRDKKKTPMFYKEITP
jgi:hypothetical protein